MADFIKQLTDALQAQLVVAAQAAYDQGFKDGQAAPVVPDVAAAVAAALAEFKGKLKVDVDDLVALIQ